MSSPPPLPPQNKKSCDASFSYIFTYLLQRIPPDIVKLTSLIHLDLSGNKLRSLPSELGDMTHLRELLLNNNALRSLPYELGKLFLLQVNLYTHWHTGTTKLTLPV